jgi:hypothetical protein
MPKGQWTKRPNEEGLITRKVGMFQLYVGCQQELYDDNPSLFRKPRKGREFFWGVDLIHKKKHRPIIEITLATGDVATQKEAVDKAEQALRDLAVQITEAL